MCLWVGPAQDEVWWSARHLRWDFVLLAPGVTCLTLDLIRRSGGIAGLFFNPKLGGAVGVRLATALEFPCRREINLFVNPRRTIARRGKQGAGNLRKGGKGVLDVRVSQS